MTNGEKLQETFPNAEISYGLRGVVAVTFIHKTIFDLDWWNAEYQEPSSSEIPTSSDDCISRDDVWDVMQELWGTSGELIDRLMALPSVTPIRPKGYWREVDTNMYACSKCSHVLTIDPLDNSILEMNTCPFCSAEMEGVVDDKGRSKTLVRNRTENVGR